MNQQNAGKELDRYRGRVVIADGDTRREWLARGASVNEWADSIVPGQSQLLRSAADAFLDAGALVLVTPTADANAVRQAESSLGNDGLLSLNREVAASYRAAIQAHPRSGEILLLGAIGPVEELLTLGEIEEKTLAAAYRAQATALVEGGADAIICRAFTELDALQVAVKAVQAASNLPILATLCFDCGPSLMETAMGASIPQACELLASAGVAAIGAEGGQSPDTAPAVIAKFREMTDLPLWVTVSPGTMQIEEGRIQYPEPPKEFAARYKLLARAGANFIGGAAGATAAHIAALAAARKGDKQAK